MILDFIMELSFNYERRLSIRINLERDELSKEQEDHQLLQFRLFDALH